MNGLTFVMGQLPRVGLGGRRLGAGAVLVGLAIALLLLSASLYGGAPAAASRVAIDAGELPAVTELLERATRVGSALAQVEELYDVEIAPIERVLRRYRNDPELARRIALALTREAAAVGLEPRILLAVLLVENPWLDPGARSQVGARGLMQVMPLHEGRWGCEGDMDAVETNICYGARIFANYYRQTSGDVDRALLKYNGCIRGTNTPNCKRYPYHVYARAGYAAVLEWLDAKPLGAASP